MAERPIAVELAEAIFHLRHVVTQHRAEVDELRDRLDTLQKTDTWDRRRLIPLGGGEPDPLARVRGLYRGVWTEGRDYRQGDLVTRSGGLWHANEDTTDKPGTSKAWVLVVKSGRASDLER